MTQFWERPSIKYIAFGFHADRPTLAPATHNAWYSIDTGALYMSDIDRNWTQISGGNIPLIITTGITLQSNQQIVAAKTSVSSSGGLLTIESGSLLRFVA